MKLFLSVLLLSISIFSSAQSRQKIAINTTAYKVFNFGRSATVTTTGATTINIDSIPIAAKESGIIEVSVVGFNDSTSTAVTGVRLLRYVKAAGTLTLGTAATPLAAVVDTELTGATFTTAASANNIVVTVTGKSGYTIKWKAVTRKVNP